jgi:hypothetical protein
MNEAMRAILAPAAILVLWTLVMLGWMVATRIPAMGGLASLGKAPAGGRGQNLERVLPPQINWKAHNYAHLTEQPTLFYAVIAILALLGANRFDVALAWAYVGLRVIHSLWQATVNRIPVRFALFSLYTVCLVVLALHAAVDCFAARV